jgi:hypothetical protein
LHLWALENYRRLRRTAESVERDCGQPSRRHVLWLRSHVAVDHENEHPELHRNKLAYVHRHHVCIVDGDHLGDVVGDVVGDHLAVQLCHYLAVVVRDHFAVVDRDHFAVVVRNVHAIEQPINDGNLDGHVDAVRVSKLDRDVDGVVVGDVVGLFQRDHVAVFHSNILADDFSNVNDHH